VIAVSPQGHIRFGFAASTKPALTHARRFFRAAPSVSIETVLESALKGFSGGFPFYQCLFKSNRSNIPFASYDDPLIDAAIDRRREFLRSKRDGLYQIEIFYLMF
jgi:hypothetical protein